MGKYNHLTKDYATRERIKGIQSIYKALPDPDKILEENNYHSERFIK